MRVRVAMVVLAAAGAAGCSTLSPTAGDERSGAAERIRAEENTPRRWPTFADIPATPRDVRTVAQYDDTVRGVQGDGNELRGWVTSNPAINTGTEAFVASQRDRAAQAGAPVSADQQARTDAFVAEARRRATPPPPPS